MTRREAAMANFMKGYNCSQSIALAFADLVPMDESTLLKMASSFGGGMGRLREVCGSVSGMFMTAGLIYGVKDSDAKAKGELYKKIQELANRFKSQNGSIICRELLEGVTSSNTPIPSARTDEYYKKRPCVELVGDAVEILEQFIESENPKELQI